MSNISQDCPPSTPNTTQLDAANYLHGKELALTINPKFRALIPPLAPEELARLEANILADGCRDPLAVWKDTILDGHNRYDICKRHKIPFDLVDIALEDEDSACVWIIRNQFGRRNITLAARCLLAEALAERLKPKAKENLKASGGDRKSSKAKSGSPILGKAIDTLKQAAKEAGVSHGTLAAFRMVQKHADGATMAELLTNPEKKLHRVAKDIKENQAKAARQRKD